MRNMLCGDCKQALEVKNTKIKCNGYHLYVLYKYNDFIENMIFQYKEGRDIALAPVFFHEVHDQIHRMFRYHVIVLMPSSKEKTMERGFRSLYEMVKACKLPIIDPFYKTENHKQSLQTYENRKHITQVIKIKTDYKIPHRKLLLIDDVCTSGSTLDHAYHLLKDHHKHITALALCAHPRFLEFYEKGKIRKRTKLQV